MRYPSQDAFENLERWIDAFSLADHSAVPYANAIWWRASCQLEGNLLRLGFEPFGAHRLALGDE